MNLAARARELYSGRKVTVMGLGLFEGGSSVTRFLAEHGAEVTVTDLRNERELAPALARLSGLPVRYVLGEHRVEDFRATSLVIANPAVAPSNAYLQSAREAQVDISSEVAMFLELCPARIAAITGTQGKSSTSHSLHQLLRSAGLPALLGGNIGHSLLSELEGMSEDDLVVLELSSYQLEALPQRWACAPRVEVVGVVNVLADHLERHGTIEAYAQAKQRILELVAATHGHAVLPAQCPRLSQWRSTAWKRVDLYESLDSGRDLHFSAGQFRYQRESLGAVADLRLPGQFQRINALQALGMARLLGASAERLAAGLACVRGLPHRMEELGTFQGVRVIDNGVSTTPDSTISALECLEPGLCLMVGGKPKNLPIEALVECARGRVRELLLFGAAAESYAPAFRAAGMRVQTAPSVQEAVALAFQGLGEGDTLLFSPACASYDKYLNFQDRALDFRAALPR